MPVKNIIKNNGSSEPFNPTKINKWGIWSAESVKEYVDWSSVVMAAVKDLPETVRSRDLQLKLIDVCVEKSCRELAGDAYNIMAGHLFSSVIHKDVHANGIPSVKAIHKKLLDYGLMVELNYSDEDYDAIEEIIDHDKDFNMTKSQLDYFMSKYAIQNRVLGIRYETPQFTYMRMAMALAEPEQGVDRLQSVKDWYNAFSDGELNAPSPNYTNLGTPLNSYFSCCLYASGDSADSLATGDHIAYKMTCESAGIGNITMTRSVGDPVRNGSIEHQGKRPYYASLGKAVKANLQNGRGGSATTFMSAFDPEIKTLQTLKNPKTPIDVKNRDIDYATSFNRFFAKKAARQEDVFLFNVFTAPDLYDAFFSSDEALFEELYLKYEQDEDFKKTYVSARDIVVQFIVQSHQTGRFYYFNADEVNRHTPFKEPVRQSNLCLEIVQPTKPYIHITHLYDESNTYIDENGDEQEKGEVSLCALAAINVAKFPITGSYNRYSKVVYLALKMIDRCIDISNYAFPHLKTTAKARRNAGNGIIGLAQALAMNSIKYSTSEGKAAIHRIAERHMFANIEMSLKLAKELGPADWMHKTKWPDGWLPIDTYNKRVDDIVSLPLQYDWEKLRKEVVANGGIRNSVLVAHMPSESSSKATGTTNGLYPIRDIFLLKTDANGRPIRFVAPNSHLYGKDYELAWGIDRKDLIEVYSIVQKFTDQSISADEYNVAEKDEELDMDHELKVFFHMLKYGMKTRYYLNTKTTDGNFFEENIGEAGCAGGSCTL